MLRFRGIPRVNKLAAFTGQSMTAAAAPVAPSGVGAQFAVYEPREGQHADDYP